MLSRIQYIVEGFFRSSAGIFEKGGFSPSSITALGFLFTLMASVLYSTGLPSRWEWGGAILTLLLAGFFDALDGAMARRYQKVSKMGGVLDSVLDRVGEIALYSALALGRLVGLWWSLWAISASLMVSYVRTRVEVEGVVLKGVGLAERPERLLIILVSTVLVPLHSDTLLWGVGLVAALASLTVGERLYRANKILSKKSG